MNLYLIFIYRVSHPPRLLFLNQCLILITLHLFMTCTCLNQKTYSPIFNDLVMDFYLKFLLYIFEKKLGNTSNAFFF